MVLILKQKTKPFPQKPILINAPSFRNKSVLVHLKNYAAEKKKLHNWHNGGLFMCGLLFFFLLKASNKNIQRKIRQIYKENAVFGDVTV